MILPNRHLSVFNPDKFKDNITVCGCGATGSRIISELLKLGIENIHIFDFDTVSEENVSNQAFNNTDIGKPKVQAMLELATLNNMAIDANNAALTTDYPADGYLFMCADSMDVRRSLIKNWAMSPANKGIIEMRMGADELRVYAVRNFKEYSEWLKVSEYKDEEASESFCGSKTSVGATAALAAAISVWQFINLVNKANYSNEIILNTNPFDLCTRNFK